MENVKCIKCGKSNAIKIKIQTRKDGNGFDIEMKPCKYCKIAFDWKTYNEMLNQTYGINTK